MRAALAVTLCACVTTNTFQLDARLPCARDQWRTVASAHFDVYTDRSDAKAHEIATDLEQIYAAFSEAEVLRIGAAPSGRITVVAFGDREDFWRLYPNRDTLAFYTTVHDEIEPRPLIVLWAQVWRESRQTLVHELSHRFLFHVAPGAPRWLVEGLAQYQESVQLKNGEAIVGELPDGLERFNRRVAPRSEIMAGRSEDFYPGAFALVHLLNDTPERQEKFRRYLDQLAAGVAPEAAFAELRYVDWFYVDRDLPAYLPRLSYVTRRCAFHPRPVEVSAPRAIGDAELHRLWASIRPWRRENALLVENDLTEAESLQPGASETALLHAAHLHTLGDDALALQQVEPVVRARPDDPAVRALHALLSLTNERKQLEPHLADVIAEAEWLAAVAKTPGVLRAVAIVFAALGRGGDALSACDAALRLAPGDDSLHELRALALQTLQRDPEASRELQLAIALTPHDDQAQRRRRQLLLEKLR